MRHINPRTAKNWVSNRNEDILLVWITILPGILSFVILYKHFHILMYLFPNVQSCVNIIFILKSDKHEPISLSTRIQTLHVRMFHITIDVDITCLLDRTSTWKLVLNNLSICWHQKIVCICQLLISLLLSSYGGSVFFVKPYQILRWFVMLASFLFESRTLIKLLPWPFVLFLVLKFVIKFKLN